MFFNKKILILFLAVFVFAAPLSAYATEDDDTQTVTLSRDNSLKSLTLSSGTLSPEFTGSNTHYTATVGYSVTDIVVDAQLSNSSATINSITGNTDLEVGENNINITITSEAGTEAVYTIVVTRLSAEESGEDELVGTVDEDEAGEADEEDEEYDPEIIINEDGTVSVDGTTYEADENNYITEPEGQVYSETVYNELEDQYKSLKKKAIIGMVVACILILVLIFMLVNRVLRSKVSVVDEPVFDGDAPEDNSGIRHSKKTSDEQPQEKKENKEKKESKENRENRENRENKEDAENKDAAASMDTLGMLAVRMHEKISGTGIGEQDVAEDTLPEIVIVSPEDAETGTVYSSADDQVADIPDGEISEASDASKSEIPKNADNKKAADTDAKKTGKAEDKAAGSDDDYTADVDYKPDEDYVGDENSSPDADYASVEEYDPDEDYAAEDTDYAADSEATKAESEELGRRSVNRKDEAIFDTVDIDPDKSDKSFLVGKKEVTNKKSTINIIDLNDL